MSHPDFWSRPLPYWRTVLAATPYSAAAIWFYWARLFQCGICSYLRGLPPLTITRISFIDGFLSWNVHLIKEALNPNIPPFLSGFVSSLATVTYLPIIEASRESPNVPLSPFWTGIYTQCFGRGVLFPWWYSTFAATPGASRRSPGHARGSSISQYDAEANLFTILSGYIIPAILMSKTRSEGWILTWFLYPFTFALLPKFYKSIRKLISCTPKNHRASTDRGHQITLLVYIIGFVYASYLHLSVCAPIMLDPVAMKELLAPRVTFPTPSSVSKDPLGVAKTILEAIRWDAWITFFASIGATMAFARSKREAIRLAIWAPIGLTVFGTGGVLNAVWFCRELRLKKDRENPELETLIQQQQLI